MKVNRHSWHYRYLSWWLGFEKSDYWLPRSAPEYYSDLVWGVILLGFVLLYKGVSWISESLDNLGMTHPVIYENGDKK